MAQRRRRDAAKERQWRKMVREQARSGLTIRDYCHQRGLAENSFYFWRQELARRQAEKSSAATASAAGAPRAKLATFAPVTVVGPHRADPAPTMEIVLHEEVRVRLFADVDRALLREVLAVLQGEPC